MSIIVDVFEPKEIEALIASSIDTVRMSLEPQGKADYFFFACDGHSIQIERKQAGELVSNIEHVEEQLRREIPNADETILLWEGVLDPVFAQHGANCMAYHKAKSSEIMVPGRPFNQSYSALQAWFYQLDKCGVTIINTTSYIATALTIVAIYNSSQKQEHTTLKRYIKEKVHIEKFNPQVVTLMGIEGANLGEVRARALIDRYSTVWEVLRREPEELAETKNIGIATAQKLLRSVGRSV
jgi:ERCC4-type nuclease